MGKGESSYQSILQPQKVLAYSSFCRMPIELLKKILTQAESERASDPWLEPYIAARLFDEETKKRVLKISPSDSQTW